MEQLIRFFPEKWSKILLENVNGNRFYREIRIRVGCPIILISNMGEQIVKNKEREVIPTCNSSDIYNIFEAVNEYSVYAHMDSIRQGFITVKGGHRIGFSGHAVIESGDIKYMNSISSINMRVSHQIKGIADKVIEKIVNENGVKNTLIISPPGKGKTTLLREIVRKISGQEYCSKNTWNGNISVIDERGEIAGMYDGIPSNDLGIRTDVIDGISKSEGINLMLKSMAPDVIALDEIGSQEDIVGIKKALKSGCSVIATAHGRNVEDICNNPDMREIFERVLFEKYIVIKKVGDYCILD